MNNRRRRTAIVLVLLAIPVSFVLWQYLTLRSYHAFILENYTAEITQLESAMQQWPERPFQDDTYERIEALRAELDQTFSSGDFYRAGWSFDSHHGAQGTGFPDGGFSRVSWVSTTGELRDSLHYGRSFDGVPLLVYHKWLPKNRVMRHIVIVLYRDKVDRSMKSSLDRKRPVNSGHPIL